MNATTIPVDRRVADRVRRRAMRRWRSTLVAAGAVLFLSAVASLGMTEAIRRSGLTDAPAEIGDAVNLLSWFVPMGSNATEFPVRFLSVGAIQRLAVWISAVTAAGLASGWAAGNWSKRFGQPPDADRRRRLGWVQSLDETNRRCWSAVPVFGVVLDLHDAVAAGTRSITESDMPIDPLAVDHLDRASRRMGPVVRYPVWAAALVFYLWPTLWSLDFAASLM